MTRRKKSKMNFYLLAYMAKPNNYTTVQCADYYASEGTFSIAQAEATIKEKHGFNEVSIFIRTEVSEEEFQLNSGIHNQVEMEIGETNK